MPRTKSKDVAAETVSTDSLSFAGLICIEDKSYESLKHARRGRGDPDFEFNSAVDKSIDIVSNNKSLADVLFSNGHLVPQAIQTNETEVLEHVDSKNSSRPPRSSKNIAGSAKKADTNKANKQNTTASQWFGQKIIQSIATPCRDCRAVQPSPSMKEHSIRQ